MDKNITNKIPRWKSLLYYAALLVGLPITGWAIGEHRYVLAAVAGGSSVLALLSSFTVKRCPSCRERLLTISYPASHCPKCGTPFS